ncbi:Lsr2 family protein [Pseudonocardia sp. ICBG1142]|uniref:histone-like nucleoid-structuring protein Lsr2 n=1 Tax=Pseudonocardia sp. ICBG1142 TaxID=2846760 RepID=UPI001CF6542E|nr:Lsr2 family protein [Pseudonocardia sp. ICBG1142]
MAKIQIECLVDDLTGGDAHETVAFAIDGVGYEIDLSSENADRLRADLAVFVARARLVPVGLGSHGVGVVKPRRLGSTATTAVRRENRRIRDWAQENGWPIAEKGRIPVQVVDAYRRSQPA